ncbi:MAG: putatively rane-anchored aldehyde dehydrogenase [Jatrophihabitantaceae bacterium]|nr:putatively rane-anchored aldehyde dehydrogenase [Jatrophihabitantaceae bacterium]
MPTEKKSPVQASRVTVRKTYKLYIGGAFPRSESGRVYPVTSSSGDLLAQAAQASRKDVRDAVVAARGACAGWSGATAYNRGQVIYRIAEMLEGRRDQFAAEVAAAEGLGTAAAEGIVDASVDRLVWYAGWTDKYAQITGGANPVSGPYINYSVPEPSGVIGVLAPQQSSLLGLISVVAPVIAMGNTCVVVSSFARPLPAISLAEALGTSDLPGGVVNVLSGSAAELAPWLAAHRDVNGIDITGAAPEGRANLLRSASDTVKRTYSPAGGRADGPGEEDWATEPALRRMAAFVETKTVWHPLGI